MASCWGFRTEAKGPEQGNGGERKESLQTLPSSSRHDL